MIVCLIYWRYKAIYAGDECNDYVKEVFYKSAEPKCCCMNIFTSLH